MISYFQENNLECLAKTDSTTRDVSLMNRTSKLKINFDTILRIFMCLLNICKKIHEAFHRLDIKLGKMIAGKVLIVEFWTMTRYVVFGLLPLNFASLLHKSKIFLFINIHKKTGDIQLAPTRRILMSMERKKKILNLYVKRQKYFSVYKTKQNSAHFTIL